MKFLSLFILVLFSYNCSNFKSDLQGTWKLHSYTSIEGEKQTMSLLKDQLYWHINSKNNLQSFSLGKSDTIFNNEISFIKKENNITFSGFDSNSLIYFTEKDTLFIYPISKEMSFKVNTPLAEELIFYKVK
jgi:hypothetical protein